ncbi:hypothetical protein HanRHA438_Chr11g0488901 [Helianthus annuus]|nr:hypothetical protein HanRHA438_Chr11g0488901 [Helianthus annuus]
MLQQVSLFFVCFHSYGEACFSVLLEIDQEILWSIIIKGVLGLVHIQKVEEMDHMLYQCQPFSAYRKGYWFHVTDFTGKSSIREMTELCSGISGNKEKKKFMLSIVYYVDLSL